MRRRLLVLEALILLVATRIVIAAVPYRWLTRVFAAPARGRTLEETTRIATIRRVQRAIHSAASRLPGEWLCFPRAAAAQIMLRRRGVATTLCYGAAVLPDAGLTAHVWLEAHGIGVIGHETAARYHLLATYGGAPGSFGYDSRHETEQHA